MSRDRATLLDVVKAASLVIEFHQNMDKASFLDDPKTQSAVLHQLLVLGEAVKRLSEPFRAQRPDVPWKAMAGMRDKLIHEYDDIDLDEVWKTVTTEIPRLLAILEPLVSEEEDL
jgi:uncharacterized protein with HEPN domain